MSESVAADLLQSFVRRIESLDDELQVLNADKSEVYKEAKGAGFDVKVMRKLIADRRKDASERSEFEAIYDLYAEALGMYRSTGERPVRAHVENIEQFPVEHDADGVFPDDEPQSAPTAAQMRQPGKQLETLGAGLAMTSLAGVEGITDQQPIQPETANEIESGERAVTGIGPESTASVGRRLPEDAPDAALAAPSKPLRPHCKQPYACGGQGKKHCWKCLKAAGLEDAA